MVDLEILRARRCETMFPVEYLLAAALLTAPADAPDPVHSPAFFAAMRPALQDLALQWELLDPREVRFILARHEDFANDLAMLRRRYAELHDAPLLCDGYRFPDRGLINDMLSFNRAYRQSLDVRQPIELARADELRAVLQEVDHLYQVYDKLRDARCEYYYVTVRRQALKQLRELVGAETYYRGELPPVVPVWRFEAVNP